jgi:cell wall assembly regulator SMI1
MTEIERLTTDQLAELERLLIKQGAPVVQRFQPPASREALAAVEAYLQLPLPLPRELRQWWEWHDGTDVKPHERAVQGLIGPSFIFLGAEDAIQVSRECRAEAVEIAPEEPESLWGPTWLAIGTHGMVACDCAVGEDAPVPVLDVDYHHTSTPGAVVAKSLGEMVGWWIEALETGAWAYEPERDWWRRRSGLISPDRERTGLV